MKNSKPQAAYFLYGLLSLVLSLVISPLTLQAQSQLNADGTLQKISRNGNQAIDYLIPSDLPSGYLYLKTEGADGGYRHYGASGKDTGGGEGATITAIFPVGDGTDQLAPGSTLRFIIGEKGGNRTGGTLAACGGGGGTGIFYKAEGQNNWKLLMVAGAGSGAYLDGNLGTLATVRHGYPGLTTESGQQGGGGGSQGGTNGTMGSAHFKAYMGYSGGGVYASVDDVDKSAYGHSVWSAKLTNNYSTAPAGGQGGTTAMDGVNGPGGWGCGGGGAADEGGGGGGGYSGGGGGDRLYPGGGGGSYVNPMAVESEKIQNGSTTSPGDGFAEYQFSPIATTEPNAGFYITPTANSDMTICKQGNVSDVDNGTDLYLYDRITSDQYLGNKMWSYNLASKTIQMTDNTGKCIDLKERNTSNGTPVWLISCNETVAQQWLLEDGMIKYNADPSKCLIMKDNNTNSGNDLVIYTCASASSNQKNWTLHAVNDPVYVTMKSTIDAGTKYVLTKDGDIDKVDSDPILTRVAKYSNSYYTPNKIWRYQPSDYSFHFDRYENKCIDLYHRTTSNGSKVVVHDCNGTEAQQWIMSHNMIKYKANTSKCLIWGNGLASGKADNQLVIWDCDDSRVSDAQKLWTYEFE